MTDDLSAMLPRSRNAACLSDGDTVQGSPDVARINRPDGASAGNIPVGVPRDAPSEPGEGYEHFTLKEIDEQPRAVADAMRGRVSFDTYDVTLEDFTMSDEALAAVERIVLVGMGTSLHAAMIGRYWIESLARIPCETDNSSEFRYRDPLIDRRTLVISVSQSGETADTLAAMEAVRGKCAGQLTIYNEEGAQATRIADWSILMRAGPEVGVAASKTFTCSLTALYLLAIHLGARRGTLAPDRRAELVRELERLPAMLMETLKGRERYMALARRYAGYSNLIYLGRGNLYPLAIEGALKLKEMSYVHAEGYAAGEFKHGPLSLIDDKMPVVALVPAGGLRDKMLGNIGDVRARGARVVAVAADGDTIGEDLASDVVHVPRASGHVTPILMAVPLQLLAYHIAVARGCDVDRPRHLVKAVTVE